MFGHTNLSGFIPGSGRVEVSNVQAQTEYEQTFVLSVIFLTEHLWAILYFCMFFYNITVLNMF